MIVDWPRLVRENTNFQRRNPWPQGRDIDNRQSVSQVRPDGRETRWTERIIGKGVMIHILPATGAAGLGTLGRGLRELPAGQRPARGGAEGVEHPPIMGD